MVTHRRPSTRPRTPYGENWTLGRSGILLHHRPQESGAQEVQNRERLAATATRVSRILFLLALPRSTKQKHQLVGFVHWARATVRCVRNHFYTPYIFSSCRNFHSIYTCNCVNTEYCIFSFPRRSTNLTRDIPWPLIIVITKVWSETTARQTVAPSVFAATVWMYNAGKPSICKNFLECPGKA